MGDCWPTVLSSVCPLAVPGAVPSSIFCAGLWPPFHLETEILWFEKNENKL